MNSKSLRSGSERFHLFTGESEPKNDNLKKSDQNQFLQSHSTKLENILKNENILLQSDQIPIFLENIQAPRTDSNLKKFNNSEISLQEVKNLTRNKSGKIANIKFV